MRQVFSSQRLENVETVAQMLRDADIEVRITNGRSYKGGRRGTFSYSDSDGGSPKPAVWIVRSEDTVKARQILREAGLLETTRESFAGPSFRLNADDTPARAKTQSRALRIKLALIAGIAIVGALAIRHVVKTDIPTEALKTHPLDGSLAQIPQPLAAAVFTQELPNTRIDVACLSIDGADASPELVQAMQPLLAQPRGRDVVPASQCVRNSDDEVGSSQRGTGKPAVIVDVHAFRPQSRDDDGRVTGTLEVTAYHHRLSGSYKTLEVKQTDQGWQVARTLKHVAM
ncbi:hypothetical protein [Lysobacter arvi]|uniref:DUF2007 domain-containing protein n=1 Tax=Lysobacter arvi TaxID=3038776 RepID=A0ABU1CIE4_9GAMM|nr:hypothetical protein [Lysobacter arvi]MDR0184727.1 hypothetical protein [Lysobacter arvi]